MVALARAQAHRSLRCAGPKQRARVQRENLHAALGPALALAFEGRKAVGCEALAEYRVHVHRAVARLHEAQAQLGVFAHGG